MDMIERADKFEALMNNEELAKEFFNNDSAEDAQRWLAEHGVDFTVEEVKMIARTVAKIKSGELTQEMIEAGDVELSDEELAMASGGSVLAILGIAAIVSGIGWLLF